MSERRYKVRVVGLAQDGRLEVIDYRRPKRLIHLFINAAPISEELRVPGAVFVVRDEIEIAIPHVRRRVQFDPDGETWLTIQDRIRPVLNESWDPLRFNGVVADEYDGYIAGVYRLIRRQASVSEISDHLHRIETDSMSQRHCLWGRRIKTAMELLTLKLPEVGAS